MDPVAEIIAARTEARQRHDPHVDVCFLATVATQGGQMRAVSLRDIDDQGFGLLLNATSPKWQQLSARGSVRCTSCGPRYDANTVCTDDLSHGAGALAGYWSRKNHGSRLLEYYYDTFHPQSQPIPSRAYLLQGIEELRRRYPDKDAMPAA